MPRSIATGDWNSDGHADLATCNWGSDDVTLLLGDGQGRFRLGGTFAVAEEPGIILTGRFDLGLSDDLAVVHINDDGTPQTVQIWCNDGFGTFSLSMELPNGIPPSGAATADLNSDGIDDLVLANCSTGDASIFISNGTGLTSSFVLVPNVGACPLAVVVRDFDNDGVADLAFQANHDEIVLRKGVSSGVFTPAGTIAVPTLDRHLNAADFNGDGHMDLMVGGSGTTASLQVLLGDGTFQFAPGVLAAPVDPAIIDSSVGDFNSDGHLDALVLCGAQFDRLWFLAGDGLGNLTSSSSVGVGNIPGGGVVVGDWDENGTLDAATVHGSSNDVAIASGDGAGNFSTGDDPFLVLDFSLGITSGDFDNDGDTDLLTSSFATHELAFFPRSPAGDYTLAQISMANRPFALKSADLNQDGNLDVVALRSTTGPPPPPDGIDVFLGDGLGGFTLGWSTDFELSQLSEFDLVDLNNDNQLDIVVSASSVFVFLGNGQGAFTVVPPSTPAILGDRALAHADFNGDGFVDVVTTGSLQVSVWMGDGTGTLTLGAQLAAGQNFGSVATGDFNGDGAVDIAIARALDGLFNLALGDGLGGFALTPDQPMIYLRLLGARDLDLDGNLDLLGHGISEVVALYGDGMGGFAPPARTHVGNSRLVLLADVDADGREDIVNLSADGDPPRIRIIHGLDCPRSFKRGDANGDDRFDISDVVTMLSFLHAGVAVPCEASLDVNQDGYLNFPDPIFALNTLFFGGPLPPEPFTVCGDDPTYSGLSCDSSPCP